MQKNVVGWVEIYVQDMPRARHFYETVFQTTLQKLEGTPVEMYAFPLLDHAHGAPGALVYKPDCPPVQGIGTLVYFTCVDCAVEAARAAAHGGQIVRPKFSIGPYGYITFIADTEGNTIGLHSRQ